MDRCDVLYYCTADHHKPHTTTTETMMNAFATRVGTKLMAPALVGAVSGLTLYNTSPAVHAAAKPAVDLKKVKEDIADLIENDAEKRGDGTSLTVRTTFCELLVCMHSRSQYAYSQHSLKNN